MRTADEKSEFRSQNSEEPLTLTLSPAYRGEGIRGGAVALLIAVLFVAGGLGCQNAKDTQNLQQGYGALDLKDYQRAILAADDYLAKHPTGNGAAEAAYLRGRAFEQRTKGSDAEAQANLRD